MKKRPSLLAIVSLLGLGGAAHAEPPAELKDLVKQVRSEVADLRGWSFKKTVEPRLLGREALSRRLKKDVEEEIPSGLLERRGALLKRVGILPKDVNLKERWLDLLASQIAAFYASKEGRFYVLKDVRKRYGPLALKTVLAHELTHALDDQHLDVEGLRKGAVGDVDRSFARAAVTEGSATLLMSRYLVGRLEKAGFGRGGLLAGSTMMSIGNAGRSGRLPNAPRYFHTVLATYTCGEGFFWWTRGESADGPQSFAAAVRSAGSRPPASSEQILHPRKYWGDDRRDPPVRVGKERVRTLLRKTTGADGVHDETVGELLCAIVTSPRSADSLARAGDPAAWTNDAAKGWGGDRCFLIGHGDGGNERALWVTCWDRPKDREQFVDAFTKHRRPDGSRLIRLGKRVAVFFFGYDKDTADRLTKEMEASLPLKQNGEPWPTARAE